jgi:hypothetical protein
MILNGLGQRLPDTLEYLELDLKIDPRDLKVLLNHCKHVELNKLLVRNGYNKKVDITFNLLKEFIREKKIPNFAYLVVGFFNPNDAEHRNLKTLVSEFQPFVKMRRYDELVLYPFNNPFSQRK